MLNAFLNPWMLAGLAGLVLPVIAHLLSRKKYDQVDWGAMQFLELDPSAKRKVRLEELLLMLVRMGLIALVALALARPWIGSEWLGNFVSTQPRDVVLIIDGSYSMGWDEKGNGRTPFSRSAQLARDFLGSLRPGDSIQIVDAREQPYVVLPELTRDSSRVKEAINNLSAPAGSSDLVAALRKGIQLLVSGTNLQREIVVFTDLQALNWRSDDIATWAQFDDLRQQSRITPRIWVVDSADEDRGRSSNFAMERLQLSRELAVLGVPVKIRSRVKSFGGDELATRKVYLEIDQIRLDDQTLHIKIPPQGETTVDFEYRFETPGSHLISLVLEDDSLSGDNRADAVVTVTNSLPVLLIDGDHKLDPTKCETFFANAALLAGGNEHSWIQPTVMTPEELTTDRLKSASIAVFVASGHGVLFTMGDKIDREHYRTSLYAGGQGILPCQLDSIGTEDGNEKRGVRVAGPSLELPWLQPFRADRGGSLSDARWSRWWKVTTSSDDLAKPNSRLPDLDLNGSNPLSGADTPDGTLTIGSAVVEAKLTTGDPLLVSRRFGNGMTALFASSLDADWNTLPAKQDFVPFLHELLFSLAVPTTSRNLEANSPLILSVPIDSKIEEFQFLNPVNKPYPAEIVKGALQPTVRLRDTRVPGIYRFVRKQPRPNEANRPEYFVVNFDRAESDLTALTEQQCEGLSKEERMTFVNDLPELRKNMFAETSRAEIWWMLLYVFVASLALEAWMTRRMVQGGYET